MLAVTANNKQVEHNKEYYKFFSRSNATHAHSDIYRHLVTAQSVPTQ